MIILGVDLETTGLDPKKDKIIEIGYCLYDFTEKSELFSKGCLLQHENLSIPQELTENVHGISEPMVESYGYPAEDVFSEFVEFAKKADFLVAHNKSFEMGFLKNSIENFEDFKWIDTQYDLPFPKKITTRKLVYLAYEHGIVPQSAHRALDDVMTMIYVMNKYSEEDILKRASDPDVTMYAQVSFPQKDLAKAAGFKWDGSKKKWFKKVKTSELGHKESYEKQVGFKILID